MVGLINKERNLFMPEIRFDRPMLNRLKKAYDKATSKSKDMFTFEGNDYVTNYAKYLIEYLEEKFKKED
jgi:hypothetical protein